jgi:hypothetical protein
VRLGPRIEADILAPLIDVDGNARPDRDRSDMHVIVIDVPTVRAFWVASARWIKLSKHTRNARGRLHCVEVERKNEAAAHDNYPDEKLAHYFSFLTPLDSWGCS